MPRFFEGLKKADPGLWNVTAAEERAFERGVFDDAVNTARMKKAVQALTEAGVLLPWLDRYILNQFSAGKLKGARLEVARRLIELTVRKMKAAARPAATTKPAAGAVKGPRTVVIDVRSAGDDGKRAIYVVDGVECKDIDALTKALRTRAKARGDDAVVIRPVGTVKWDHVVAAFNVAVKLEYKKIGFAAEN